MKTMVGIGGDERETVLVCCPEVLIGNTISRLSVWAFTFWIVGLKEGSGGSLL